MAHVHYRYEDTSTHASGAARQGLRLFGRFFCAAILLGLVAAGLFMGKVSTARAQQAATATPSESFTPTAIAPTATAVGLTPTTAASATEAPSPTPEGTLQGTSAPSSTPTIIPSPSAPTPTESFSPTELATSPLPTTKPTPTPPPTQAPTVSSQTLVTATPNNYFTSLTIKAQNGVTLGVDIINGPPVPPPGNGADRKVVSQDQLRAASVTSLDVPAYKWSFGCSATSGAMIAAYYDRNGYPNMYTGPTNGGVAPSDSSSWGTWTDGTGATYAQDPLAASRLGLDQRTIRGSIDDYWVAYGSSAADPFINHWTQHSWGDAIGDFMKTSQSSYGNTDGSTSFYYQPNAARYTCSTMAAQGISQYDGTYGRALFYQAKGYTVTDCYSQETDNQYAGGFSFAQYKAEIDAGHPVMINLDGHTIVGVGYDASTNPGTVYLHDTWDYLTHTMTWGGTYSAYNLAMESVSIVNLQPSSNPVPSISSLDPSSVTAGGSDFNLTVKGANFLASSLVNWNGTALSTTYVNSTQLTAAVPANLITASGSAAITVFTPAPGGGTSSSQTFTINNPQPTTSSLDPNNMLAGSSAFSLTVNGSNFVSSSVVNWNGAALSTTFVNNTQLSAIVPSNDLTSAAILPVTVFNPGPGGGTSLSQTFTINNPLPGLDSISQTSALIGSSAFNLTANGSNFVSSSVVNWNGAALATTYLSSSQLTASVPASKLTSAGTIPVTVFNPAPGGGSSSTQTFTLNNPLPLLSSLSPSTRATGTQAFTLSVSGSNFAPGATVQWNSSDLPSTFVNSGLLTASVPAADLTSPGTATITVSNLAPGGGTSAGSLIFTLYSIDPAYGITVSSLRPTFDWPAVTGATSYNLQASTSSTFSSPFLNKTISAASYSPTSDIPGNSLIYWRVRALVNQVWGAWSETRQFHSPNPPKAPTLSSPANNALTTNDLPSLHWSEASLPANTTFSYFDLQIATKTDFVTGLIEPSNPPITTSVYTLITPLSPNTGYYCRVRAYNTAGQSSDWSSVYYLRSAMQPPTQLSSDNLLAPANLTLRPIFSWQPVDGASSYTIQISNVSNFHTTVVNSKVTGASYTPGSDLPKNTLLYWRVQALGTNGPSLWSETDSFTSANPPSTPKLSSPSSNALVTSNKLVLDWGDSSLPSGVTLSNYQIQVSAADASFANPLLNTTTTQSNFQMSSLTANTKYYWRVRAYGNNGHFSDWSGASYFRSAMLPPSMTTMANGDPVSSLRPTFSWGAVDDATNYTFQVSTSSTFSSTILNKTVTPATYTPTSNLPSGRLLYWRVRANGSNGPSLWSGGSFKTP